MFTGISSSELKFDDELKQRRLRLPHPQLTLPVDQHTEIALFAIVIVWCHLLCFVLLRRHDVLDTTASVFKILLRLYSFCLLAS